MPVPLRRFYAQKLIDSKNKERDAYENATKKTNTPNFKKS